MTEKGYPLKKHKGKDSRNMKRDCSPTLFEMNHGGGAWVMCKEKGQYGYRDHLQIGVCESAYKCG